MTTAKRIGMKLSPEDRDLANLNWGVNGNGYAHRSLPRNGIKKRRRALCHRVVLRRVIGRPLSPTDIVDHINGDKLDNRRCNLRLTDRVGNGQNRSHGPMKYNPYRNVTWQQQSSKWLGCFRYKCIRYYCGLHDTPEDALEAVRKRKAVVIEPLHMEPADTAPSSPVPPNADIENEAEITS